MLLNFDPENYTLLLGRSLLRSNYKNKEIDIKRSHNNNDIIETVQYGINSFGYRSKEFNKDNEVLILGCSQTFGSGMHNEFTWPEIFCKSINKSYSRIAMPGDSINGQVYKAFRYFEEIGNPKIVLGAFPLFRIEYTKVPGVFGSSEQLKEKPQNKLSINIAYMHRNQNIKLSEMPYDPEYILPQEFAIFYNFMFLKMLEQYCESHGIKFIWTIYDDDDIEIIMQRSRRVLKNYLKTSILVRELNYLKRKSDEELDENLMINKIKHKECYKEFKDHKLYDWAADYNYSLNLGHWGIHMHQHIADLFIERYKEIENY